MYRRASGWLFPVFAIAFIITGVWGYQQSQQKEALLIKSENHYQRAFHSLSYNVDQLQNELGKTLAAGSEKQLKKSLNNAWRISFLAQSEVGQLPLTLMPFHKTQAFLNDLGAFSYKVAAAKPDEKAPVSEATWQQLKNLYTESKDVESNIKHVQTSVISDGARFSDAEQALANPNQKQDNVIIDGFQQLEKKVSHFPEVNWGPAGNPQTIRAAKPDITHLSGPNASAQDAKQQAARFLGRTDVENFAVVKNGSGMPYPAYSVTASTGDGSTSNIELTQKGAHVTWFLHDRAIGKQTIDLNKGEDLAAKWLKDHQYADMQAISAEQYDDVGVYQFCYAPHSVVHYPEKMTVKVALDNGEVIGFQAKDYVFHNSHAPSLKPALTEQQARAKVNPHLQVQEGGLSVIHDEIGREVLVYEFTGLMDHDTYRVYINAANGDEVGIEKLTNHTVPTTAEK